MMEKNSFPTTDRKVSVIVPALNESETVASVVEFARRCPLVDQVIVVDDGSVDGTPELASAAGAEVFTSTMLGKGVSMEDGLGHARNEVILFMDGDLSSLSPDVVERMVEPILAGDADFVKARFTRSAGRVTTLTARPLLKTYFPEVAHFIQPLSGVMAARRSLLKDMPFENDYGVDIGLFIDVAMNKGRVSEVDIGHIDHDSHPLSVLEEMATQVARTILDRASKYGRLRYSYIREVQEDERHRKAELSNVLKRISKAEKLALFDMDGVLLNGRFVRELARRTEKAGQLAEFLDRFDMDVEERTRKIAAIFAGVPRNVFEQIAREMPLIEGAAETIVALRKAGYRVGIVTDSYQVAAEIVRRRVFADFSFANLLRFKNGNASGSVTLAPGMVYPGGCSVHKHCKVNVMRHLMEQMEIGTDSVITVGDGENDICMLQAADVSVAFEPKTGKVRAAGKHIVEGNLTGVLEVLQK